jgi:hypothetical protein
MAGQVEGCDLNLLKRDAACISLQCLGEPDWDAIDIVARIGSLAALGGTDYSDDPTQLDADAAAWTSLNPDEIKPLFTYLEIQEALGAGATFGGDSSIQNLRTLASCYRCMGKKRREGILLFLKCQIASEATV